MTAGSLITSTPTTGSRAAARWAVLVTRAIECPVDPRTLSDWGRYVGASVPTLRSRCGAIGVGTKASLDFTRLLRAIVRSNQTGSDPLLEFDICDMRTIRRLFAIGGLADPYQRATVPPLGQFLDRQCIIPKRTAISCVVAELSTRGFRQL